MYFLFISPDLHIFLTTHFSKICFLNLILVIFQLEEVKGIPGQETSVIEKRPEI